MNIREIYLDRLTKLIEELRAGLVMLPEGPERDEICRLMGEMEQICEKCKENLLHEFLF